MFTITVMPVSLSPAQMAMRCIRQFFTSCFNMHTAVGMKISMGCPNGLHLIRALYEIIAVENCKLRDFSI